MALSSISITAPSSAREGDRVSVSARVTNISADSYSFRVKLYAVRDIYAVPAPGDLLDTFEEIIGSGAYKTISGSFTMPAWDTIILVMVHRFLNYWDFDNYTTKVVSSIEAPVEPTYHLNVLVPSWAAGGYIDPGSGDYPAYSTVKLTAHPISGYQFTSWGGDASGTSPTFNLYMNSDKHVEAYFEKVPVEEFAGSIARKELEYDETRGNIPVY